jgi:hypothetical protein
LIQAVTKGTGKLTEPSSQAPRTIGPAMRRDDRRSIRSCRDGEDLPAYSRAHTELALLHAAATPAELTLRRTKSAIRSYAGLKPDHTL